MAIKAVIFDMGGVLLRTVDGNPRKQLAGQLGITREELEQIVFASPSAHQAEIGAIDETVHWDWVRQYFQLKSEELPGFQEAFWGGDRMDSALLDFIRELRPAYRTGLLSNAWNGARKSVAARFGGLDVFDVAVFSAEVGMRKPDPRFFQWMFDRLQVSPAEAIFVDDFIENIQAAQQLGIHTVHFRSAQQAKQDVLGLLDHVNG